LHVGIIGLQSHENVPRGNNRALNPS